MENFDTKRAFLSTTPLFEPFVVPTQGILLQETKLSPKEELLLFERGGTTQALSLRQMAYHHVAQGETEGIPYLVSF